jgi:hypothetical protein
MSISIFIQCYGKFFLKEKLIFIQYYIEIDRKSFNGWYIIYDSFK